MKFLYLRRLKFSLWKQLLFILLLILFILKLRQFMVSYNFSNEEFSENINLDQLLAQKNREVIYLKSVLQKFKVPITHYEIFDLPTIYVITPTYTRLVQKAELTRLKNTFIQVPNLTWIVVEDGSEKSKLLSKFLKSSSLSYVHLTKETPAQDKNKPHQPRYLTNRGVHQRNHAIKWLASNKLDHNSIVYFADDDNTYSTELFNEIRKTKKVGVWPVGLVGGVIAEQPLVKDGKVVAWNVGWKPERTFATDMAGFSINLGLLLSKRALFPTTSKIGLLETQFLSQIITPNELEPLANNCSMVLVWHTQTKEPIIKYGGKSIINTDIEV